MSSLKTRVEQAVRGDAAKNALLEDLLAQIELLTTQRDAAKNDLSMAQDTARTYYDKMVQAQADATKSLEGSLEGDRFVLVLVDGDSVPFLDDFVAKGSEGGEDAGKLLRIAVQAYHKSNPNYHPDDRIIIRVFANTQGSARTYKAARVIPEEAIFEQFTIGFNRSHPLSDFVNAGSHKEAADSKMRANFELFYRNRHCQHILFAGSADSGYAGFLGPFASPNSINDHITLIEGPPFPSDLKRVSKNFRNAKFETIFRSAKIQLATNGTQSYSLGVKRSAPELVSNRPAPARTDALTPTSPPPPPQVPPGKAVAPSSLIYQNQYGQRIDAPLTIDREYLQHLYDQNSKLCNNFYLKGYCAYGTNCEFDHTQNLSPLQLDTFRYKARTSTCRTSFCEDPSCCLGHLCPRGNKCNINFCKFAPEMHNPDVTQLFQYDVNTGEKKRMIFPA